MPPPGLLHNTISADPSKYIEDNSKALQVLRVSRPAPARCVRQRAGKQRIN